MESKDVMETTEKRRKKKHEGKFVRFKLDAKDHERLEQMFGEGNVTKGIKYAVKEFISSMTLPDDEQEKALLLTLRDLIPANTDETAIAYPSAYKIAEMVCGERAYDCLIKLNKELFIRFRGDKVFVKRMGKYPDPVMEFLHGGMR